MKKQPQDLATQSVQNSVGEMKNATSIILSQWMDAVIEEGLPQDVDFDSKEEYELGLKEYMMELIEEAKQTKLQIFSSVLDCYNQLLHIKYKIESDSKEQDKESELTIQKANFDMKSAGVVGVGLSLLIPPAFPFLVLINIPRISGDIFLKKYHLNRIQRNEKVRTKIKEVQDPLYEYVDQLRTNYFESKEKLEKLKTRVLNGENVVNEILELMNPERLQLRRVYIPFEELLTGKDVNQLMAKAK